MYDLQSRWKLEKGGLRYYGLRSGANMLKNMARINASQRAILQKLPLWWYLLG